MKKVFFGCSMRWWYQNVSIDELAKIPNIIEWLWFQIASRHQTQNDWKEKEWSMENLSIHDRDYQRLQESDFWIFEISNPSLWVWWEISDMLNLWKPVLCLFKSWLEEVVSAYILWKKWSDFIRWKLEFRSYKDLNDTKNIISEFVKENIE